MLHYWATGSQEQRGHRGGSSVDGVQSVEHVDMRCSGGRWAHCSSTAWFMHRGTQSGQPRGRQGREQAFSAPNSVGASTGWRRRSRLARRCSVCVWRLLKTLHMRTLVGRRCSFACRTAHGKPRDHFHADPIALHRRSVRDSGHDSEAQASIRSRRRSRPPSRRFFCRPKRAISLPRPRCLSPSPLPPH